MKKKKLLKRIEELERRNTQLENKYKRVLFEDDEKAITMERFIYKQNEKHEQLMLKGLSSGMIEFKTPNLSKESLEDVKYNSDTTFDVIEGFNNKLTIIDEPIHFKTIANSDFNIPKINKYYDPVLWSNDISYGYMCANDEAPRLNKNCKECKLKKELTTSFNIISLDDNIFDIKSRPKIEVKIFSNLVQRYEK